MNINKIDFYNLCLEEGHPFYDEIFPVDKDLFNQWIIGNLQKIVQIESFNDVTPSGVIVEELNKLGYNHIYYQCHYSAKAASILNKEIKYFTGFVERKSYSYPIITHSFNYFNNQVIDFSRINNPEDPIAEGDRGLPHTYYGIEIPTKFISNYKQETLVDKSMKPLLYEWYLEIIKKTPI